MGGFAVKAITKYIANDGREHLTTEECLKRDALCEAVDSIMSLIPPRYNDTGCNYSNGHGYWQHDADRAATVRHCLLTLAKERTPHRWIDESLADPTIDSSWAGRIINEGPGPIDTAWRRLQCMDKQWREWGQPFYALHPEQAEQFCLNGGAT